MKSLQLRILILGFLLFLTPLRSTTVASDKVEQPLAAPLFSFSVMSDVHITSYDQVAQLRLSQALADHHALRPDSKLLVLNGDLTNGSEADYRSLLALLSRKPHAPVHATMGNHDYYGVWRTTEGGLDTSKMNPTWSSKQAVALFDRMMGYDKPYHELIVEGYRFLFLSGEAYRDVNASYGEDAFLSPEQLGWLRERLTAAGSADAGKPVFVFLHQPLPQTLDGTDRELGVVQHEELRALLDAHPNVILFSGHTHWNLETTRQVKQLKFVAASSSSIREVWNAQNVPETQAISQSLVVDVYKDRVVILRREHFKKRWIEPSIAKGYDVK
ncbi:metallophosphoesterase family protein [Paenibacillus alginolyticus]|uniref:Metallophosphoesterase n=1 Tax=Paenibacillus alginolyticus TaxID=59839 RepID=A0ABT4G7E8_9BACL|nr:metallophosphoesterase [Paenibacillus alginolyticus]MCY9692080.1 metallophosphoesterase [Paenibacillus alginolyticus]MEC0147845.1 metallophosphoesterase [Paenibacillus alginolyticus]